MMPVAILRKDFANVTPALIGQANYDGVVDLVGTLGIDFDDLIGQISNPDNPDVALMKDAFLHFAVDPYDDAPEISKVLWEQWFRLTTTDIVELGTTDPNAPPDTQNFVATFEEQDIRRALVWSKQEVYDIPGYFVVMGVDSELNTVLAYDGTTGIFTGEGVEIHYMQKKSSRN